TGTLHRGKVRQRRSKSRAFPRLAEDAHRAAVRLDDGFDETQAEAEAARGAAGITAKEPIPDPRQLVGGDSGTCVAHAQERAIAVSRDLDVHAAGGPGVFHR